VEIFRIVDVDGLTPLLMVLNEEAAADISKKTDEQRGPDDPVGGGSLDNPLNQIAFRQD
jgi:hypothetical protein